MCLCFAYSHMWITGLFFLSNYTLELGKHLSLIAHVVFADSVACLWNESPQAVVPVLVCSAVTYFWDATFDKFLLPICWWRMSLWPADWRRINFWEHLTWQTLCLRNNMKMNCAPWASIWPGCSHITCLTDWSCFCYAIREVFGQFQNFIYLFFVRFSVVLLDCVVKKSSK